ncbi:purine catabolism regulator [Evansella vedderi]|uniref:Purine catabolism regulator n=1 Tax=Evansella vedderi TaxID=38282 RepID=A0ABT9ZNX4_9BACI|nr:PucR family transcriptional regulator [Evansella vedderi]MDQ0252944.1 purine catabolism regulator [Evansella vedderi]
MSKPVLQRFLVKDIVELPFFEKAVVIGDKEALERTVTWVHIMEVTNVKQLLNGNELILSTGVVWQESEEACLTFLQQLIEKDVSGLVVELLNFKNKKLPDAMVQLAKDHHFPLILFHKEVRYIDITQELHAMFLNEHHQMVSKLEKLSEFLNNSLLSGKGLINLLQDFHRFTNLDVMLFPKQGEAIFVPSLSHEIREKYANQWRKDKEIFIEAFPEGAVRPIYFLGQTFAHLVIRPRQSIELTEFEILAIDRGATAIAQEIMRSMYYEEQKSHKEGAWVQQWLTGSTKEEEVREHLHSSIGSSIPNQFLTVISEINDVKDDTTNSYYISNVMIARSFFEDKGFKIVITKLNNYVVLLLFPPAYKKLFTVHEEIAKVFHRLHKGTNRYFGTYSIGQLVHQLSQASNSYKSAKIVLQIQKRIGPLKLPAYEELHAYRTIAMMEENKEIEAFVSYYLGDLENYDNDKGKELLLTLKYYLLNNGKKKETADALHIVRQTLYHRLSKIEEVIGNIFSSQDRRLGLELAIKGYEYLYGSLHDE